MFVVCVGGWITNLIFLSLSLSDWAVWRQRFPSSSSSPLCCGHLTLPVTFDLLLTDDLWPSLRLRSRSLQDAENNKWQKCLRSFFLFLVLSVSSFIFLVFYTHSLSCYYYYYFLNHFPHFSQSMLPLCAASSPLFQQTYSPDSGQWTWLKGHQQNHRSSLLSNGSASP